MKKNLKACLFLCLTSLSVHAFAQDLKKAVYTPNAPAPIGTYSQGIQSGNTVYISGQIPVDPKTGEMVQGTINDQFRQAFVNVSEVAKAAGGTVDDILKLTIYLSDLNNFSEVNEIMKEYFHQPFPARAVIEIKALPKNASIEIEAIMGIAQPLPNE